MTEVVDARGLSCPQPVILTRQALQEKDREELRIRVSTAVARDNVARAAKSMGWTVEVKVEEEEDFLLFLKKQ